MLQEWNFFRLLLTVRCLEIPVWWNKRVKAQEVYTQTHSLLVVPGVKNSLANQSYRLLAWNKNSIEKYRRSTDQRSFHVDRNREGVRVGCRVLGEGRNDPRNSQKKYNSVAVKYNTSFSIPDGLQQAGYIKPRCQWRPKLPGSAANSFNLLEGDGDPQHGIKPAVIISIRKMGNIIPIKKATLVSICFARRNRRMGEGVKKQPFTANQKPAKNKIKERWLQLRMFYAKDSVPLKSDEPRGR